MCGCRVVDVANILTNHLHWTRHLCYAKKFTDLQKKCTLQNLKPKLYLEFCNLYIVAVVVPLTSSWLLCACSAQITSRTKEAAHDFIATINTSTIGSLTTALTQCWLSIGGG